MSSKGKLYQFEGIILGRRDHGEADRVVTLLTPEMRCDLLAKGVRKPRSRKAGHLELFAKAKILASRVNNSWDIISQADTVETRAALREDFERATYARYLAELVLRFFEGETDKQLYTFIDSTFTLLENAEDMKLLARWYEQQILILAGYGPQWQACVGELETGQCLLELHPTPQQTQPYGVDAERGGALCNNCFATHVESAPVRKLSPSALSWLQALQNREYDGVKQFVMPEKTSNELAQIMEHYISYHMERKPATLRMLRTFR